MLNVQTRSAHHTMRKLLLLLTAVVISQEIFYTINKRDHIAWNRLGNNLFTKQLPHEFSDDVIRQLVAYFMKNRLLPKVRLSYAVR